MKRPNKKFIMMHCIRLGLGLGAAATVAGSFFSPTAMADSVSREDFLSIGTDLAGSMSNDPSERKSYNRSAPNILKDPIGNDLYPHDLLFESGNAVFINPWVEKGSSTLTRDGLGPYFNARSCESCHIQDGRGNAPDGGIYPGGGLLIRLSDQSKPDHSPHPIYGDQLQDHSNPSITPEARIHVTYTEKIGTFVDGSHYSLRDPQYSFIDASRGPLEVRTSPRLAQAIIGMGLIEAIPAATIEAFADPDDADSDGISGRVSVLISGEQRSIGRFGHKSGQASVREQSAGAFFGDMGITSSLHPTNDCPTGQADCDGGRHAPVEVTDKQLDRLELYSSLLGVPRRRNVNDPSVVRGMSLFYDIGCQSCHRSHMTTGTSDKFPEVSNQLVHPFSDLLLHDMGEPLSDHRPMPQASAREWRTAPLWGIGLAKVVNPKTGFLHDGRARTIEEAILWHGGEADKSQAAYRKLTASQRADLLRFLESL